MTPGMTYEEQTMRSRVASGLNKIEKYRLTPSRKKRAAVLIILYKKKSEWNIILTKRSGEVEMHKHEISLPGGAYDEADGDILTTARREFTEELGVDSTGLDIVGKLRDVEAKVSGYVITPFVAFSPPLKDVKLNKHEIDELLETPLNELLNPANRHWEASRSSRKRMQMAYVVNHNRIWGVTARILHQFLVRCFDAE